MNGRNFMAGLRRGKQQCSPAQLLFRAKCAAGAALCFGVVSVGEFIQGKEFFGGMFCVTALLYVGVAVKSFRRASL